jgi:hypothetical protein
MLNINKEFILNTDLKELRETIFLEDENGDRYRERIIDEIEKFGVENWFKARGLPIEDESVWKNRYTGDTITLKEEISRYDYKSEKVNRIGSIQTQGYYLWENWCPEDNFDNSQMDKSSLKRWF